jgi:tRNA dimethylallyltransferase
MNSLVIIAGPTGGGKARLAMAVAEETGALLISCDSMKIYKSMDIGTAKPTTEIRQQFDWRCINLVEPWLDFDSAQFVAHAEAAILEAQELGRGAIVSGGTALYIKALTEGLFPGPGKDEALREELREHHQSQGPGSLHRRLQGIDGAAASKLHPNDVRRIIRAIEVFSLTGDSITSRQRQFGRLKENYKRSLFFVRRSREDMDERINNRVDRMMDAGWLAECEELLRLPKPLSKGPLQAIGYKQLFAHINSGQNLQEAVVDIKTKTRRFARKQISWQKHFPDARVICLEKSDPCPTGITRDIARAVEESFKL